MEPAPRVAYDDLPPALEARVRDRVERLGYLGEFFQVAANQPEPLCHFIDFTAALKQVLDQRLVEVIALTVACATGNDYERVQHERLALKIGMRRAEVAALASGSPAEGGFGEVETAAIALAARIVASRGRGAEQEYGRLAEIAGHEVAIACLMTAARYLAHASMANTWQLAPPVPSPLEPEAQRA